ncbi:uncharacterized protein BN538_01884 [Lachnospiraceae bacterium CAG:215]|nr:uncharacterized protein BN538_01884 [Lachnospiraceae bacterium CAG:215]
MARICSGVVPQHPPITAAPLPAIFRIVCANASGSTSNTVSPSRCFGSPAFGFTMTGVEEYRWSSSRIGIICSGPIPQLIPSASTRNPSKRLTKAGTSAPVKSFFRSSNTAVTNTGRLVFSFAARTAALISYVSLIVSMWIRSAPASSPYCITSRNASYASSNARSPIGFKSFPVGPTSSATYTFLPPALRRTASFPCATAVLVISSKEYTPSWNFSALAPNVFVNMISLPASIYA